MSFSIKNRDDLEKLEAPASYKYQVEDCRLQDKLGNRTIMRIQKILFDPLTDTIVYTSEKLTENITETYVIDNKALESLNQKVSEVMND